MIAAIVYISLSFNSCNMEINMHTALMTKVTQNFTRLSACNHNSFINVYDQACTYMINSLQCYGAYHLLAGGC